MRITMSGTKEAIAEACVTIACEQRRDRSDLQRRRDEDAKRKKAQGDVIRKAFLLVRSVPDYKEIVDRFASVLGGRVECTNEIVGLAHDIIDKYSSAISDES